MLINRIRILFIITLICVFITGLAFLARHQLLISDTRITRAVLTTNFGDMEIIFTDSAPLARANFIRLARQHFYDGIRFHRIVKDFAIQSGDPLSRDLSRTNTWGTGNPGYYLPSEVNTTDLMPAGSVVMAADGDRSHGSQFLILAANTPWLAGHNTKFAYLTRGLDVATAISQLATGVTGIPGTDVILLDVVLFN